MVRQEGLGYVTVVKAGNVCQFGSPLCSGGHFLSLSHIQQPFCLTLNCNCFSVEIFNKCFCTNTQSDGGVTRQIQYDGHSINCHTREQSVTNRSSQYSRGYFGYVGVHNVISYSYCFHFYTEMRQYLLKTLSHMMQGVPKQVLVGELSSVRSLVQHMQPMQSVWFVTSSHTILGTVTGLYTQSTYIFALQRLEVLSILSNSGLHVIMYVVQYVVHGLSQSKSF